MPTDSVTASFTKSTEGKSSRLLPRLFGFGFVFIAFIAILTTWNYFHLTDLIKYRLLSRYTATSSLVVTVENGIADVFEGDQQLGSTPLELSGLKPRLLNLRLVRQNNNGFYQNLEIPIELRDKTQTVVKAGIGPTLDSSWYLVSTIVKNLSKQANDSALMVLAFPVGSNVVLDDSSQGQTPLDVYSLAVGVYRLKIAKDGYQSIESNVDIKDGSKVVINAKLAQIAIKL